MKLIWLGHGSFRIETGDLVLLLDPWLTGNPVLPEDQHEAAVVGGTHLILTHAQLLDDQVLYAFTNVSHFTFPSG